MIAPSSSTAARPMVTRLFMTALPFLLHRQPVLPAERIFRDQAAMNMQRFRYFKLADTSQNAISDRKITH
jgi:hypothetical protein